MLSLGLWIGLANHQPTFYTQKTYAYPRITNIVFLVEIIFFFEIEGCLVPTKDWWEEKYVYIHVNMLIIG